MGNSLIVMFASLPLIKLMKSRWCPWASGRALEEQLCELTRLVARLPEVDGLLQRAGLQATATRLEPTSVMEMFVKVAHGVTGVECTVEPLLITAKLCLRVSGGRFSARRYLPLAAEESMFGVGYSSVFCD